jgi:hypothetical protein
MMILQRYSPATSGRISVRVERDEGRTGLFLIVGSLELTQLSYCFWVSVQAVSPIVRGHEKGGDQSLTSMIERESGKEGESRV